MPSAPLPENESERLASLLSMKVLDTPAEDRFDRLTRLTRRHFQALTRAQSNAPNRVEVAL